MLKKIKLVLLVLLAIGMSAKASEVSIPVPNGDFEKIYKPGSTTITADLDQGNVGEDWTQGAGWTQGVGPAAPTDIDSPSGTISRASYADGTVDYSVDIPGWIGADWTGWIAHGGTYDRDPTNGNLQGSVTRQININNPPPMDMDFYYLANGGNWSNPAGGLIVSDAPLTTIGINRTYKLSMLARWRQSPGATPLVLELLADGVKLEPSSSVNPALSGEWQVFSRTYDAASLSDHLGKSLTIQLGVGRGASGNQTLFDDVSLSYVPEPITPISIPVPNGSFEQIYKPGSTTITGVISASGWTQGVGPDCPIDSGQYDFSDQTSGTVADIPGWIGYDRDGWIAMGGSYGRDQTTGNLQGSVAGPPYATAPDGQYYYLANGGPDWPAGYSNAAGGLIVSDAALDTAESNRTYTISMLAKWRTSPGANPVELNLLADGVALTPSSSVSPVLSGTWQTFSRTYDAASLSAHIGKSLTIQLGVGRPEPYGAVGTQTLFDAVSLSYTLVNTAPEANTGSDQTVHTGTIVNLNGSASYDSEMNYPLTYEWQILAKPNGSQAELDDPGIVNPWFIPDLPGDYLIELIVTDSLQAQSVPDEVLISTYNTCPVADAGPDLALLELNVPVQLGTAAGRNSYDTDGDDITYCWEILSKPTASQAELDNSSSATPAFTPDVYGDYEISLVVSDPWCSSEPDSVIVSFENIPPVACTNGNQSKQVDDVVSLDGTCSHDANNDALSYIWSLVSKPGNSLAQIADPTASQTSFVADLPGTFVVSLVVNDGEYDSEPQATATIYVISHPDAVTDELQNTIDIVNSLPVGSLKNKKLTIPLTNKINAVIEMVDLGLHQDALDKLEHDILAKTNGCAVGGLPDKNDWIRTCQEQEAVYDSVTRAIVLLNTLPE